MFGVATVTLNKSLGAMTESVSLRIKGGMAKVSAAGLELVPWFSRKSVLVGWDNVMCVSPIPFTSKVDGEWKTFQRDPVTAETLRKQIRFYAIQVGLHNRQKALAAGSLPQRIWLMLSVWLKPLYAEEDKPHPAFGCVELTLRKRWVRRNGAELMAALELVQRYSRFDHLGSW